MVTEPKNESEFIKSLDDGAKAYFKIKAILDTLPDSAQYALVQTICNSHGFRMRPDKKLMRLIEQRNARFG